jgi:GNAT superfamily N-acetyltransferase
MRVRRVEPEGWRELAELRLRALVDASAAFESTFEQERDRPEREWRDWAAALAGGVDSIGFVVDDGAGLHGMAVGFVREERPERASLVSMWVAPEVRRRGLGSELVERVVGWAEDRGSAEVALWVNEASAAAAGLYERAGFAATGGRKPLASTPGAIEIELALPLPR